MTGVKFLFSSSSSWLTDLISVGDKEVEAGNDRILAVAVEKDLSILWVRNVDNVVSHPRQPSSKDLSVLPEETFDG